MDPMVSPVITTAPTDTHYSGDNPGGGGSPAIFNIVVDVLVQATLLEVCRPQEDQIVLV